MPFQFVFDPNRCTGCQACVVGCWMENREKQALNWRQVHTFNAFRHPALPLFHLSLACHHCEDPACLRNCPADAYTKDAATGAVAIHAERCMGCRYCTWACPHDAPKFNPAMGTIEKCTFCPERIGQGLEPACVARCPVEALGFEASSTGDRHQDLPGFPPSEIRPAIRFVPLRRSEPPVVGFAPEPGAIAAFLEDLLRVPQAKITLRGEWTLVLFTTIQAALAAWFLAARMGGPRLPAAAFLGLGLPALLLSAWHLGRRERAWRAILHLRTSWLSREIFLTGAFLGLGSLHLLLFPASKILAWSTALAGFAGLFAIDRIYRVALRTGRWNLHSSQALLNGLYLLGMLAGLPGVILLTGLAKLALYAHRKRSFVLAGRRWRPLVSALRLALGFFLPLVLVRWNPLAAALSCVLGDFVDRCEFYDELDVATPQGEIAAAVRRGLASPGPKQRADSRE
jgi:Fe-S-cluster-containing dehydrogenase component